MSIGLGWLQISLDLDKFIVCYWSIHRWEKGNIIFSSNWY